MIKKWNEFEVNESSNYDYGCVMVETPFPNWNEITGMISPEDLYIKEDDDTYGIQKNPHVTLLYGLHSNVKPVDVEPIIKSIKGLNIKVNSIDIFENDEFDVVKFNVVNNPQLTEVFNELSKLPNSNTFPDYSPHITIAYVKKGLGSKYINSNWTLTIDVYRVVYSMSNGERVYFYLS